MIKSMRLIELISIYQEKKNKTKMSKKRNNYQYLQKSSKFFGIVLILFLLQPNKLLQTNATNVYVPIFLSDQINANNFTTKINDSLPHNSSYAIDKSVPASGHSLPITTNTKHLKHKVPSQTHSSHPPDESSTFNHIIELTRNLETKFKKHIRNVELGIPIIQEIIDTMEFAPISRNDTELVSKMSHRLTKKLSKTFGVINATIEVIQEHLLDLPQIFLHSILNPCPYDEQTLDQHYDKTQIEIKNYLKNMGQHHQSQHDQNYLNYSVNNQLLDTIKQINYSLANFKQIYFLSKDDFASEHNCHTHNSNLHLRTIFTSAIKHKHIMLLIDHGSSLNVDQLELTKSFGNSVISMLDEHDKVSIVAISDKSLSFHDDVATNDDSENISAARMFHATMDNKVKFSKFINNLNRTKEITNHSLAFQHSFRVLREIFENDFLANKDVPVLMLYISRGLLSPLTEAKGVLEAIAEGQRNLPKPVIINTCAIVLDEKRVMYEKQFLKDVAVQNYTKYNIDVRDWLSAIRFNLSGHMFVVNKRYADDMLKISAAIFAPWFKLKYMDNRIVTHLPIVTDTSTKDMIISISKPAAELGVFGVDMYLSDLTEDVMNYNKYQDSYAFIIDLNGIVIMHPAYPRPLTVQSNIFPTNIQYLEQAKGFDIVYGKMMTNVAGNQSVFDRINGIDTMLRYTWHHVASSYIICVVTVRSNATMMPVYLSRINSGIDFYQPTDIINDSLVPELSYHRIDLIPINSNLCKHFKQTATMESVTLYLSPSSFISPYVYLKNNREANEETRIHNAKSIMAYIKDTTNLLANPGLLPQIRNDVTALLHIMSYLKKRHTDTGIFRKYIIRRYVATMNGVIQVYPGCLISYDFEPMRRSWFKKALEYPGKIVLTEPYLDAGGAGYIITISHTIFEGKSNALHNAERDMPIAIVSIDLTLGFFYKLLLQAASFCADANVKCFLMEDKGFLLSHPSILEPMTLNSKNSRRPLEHITHKESYMANDILYHKTLVQKKLCTNFLNRTNQRYFQFNTSLTDILTNRVHGERTKYQITAIPGTNIFIGLLNSTCDGGAFCPCSTVDRICLNCNRMELTNCECPCECPLVVSNEQLDNQLTIVNSSEVCPAQPEQLSSITYLSYELELDIKSCVPVNCDVYVTQNDCLGIMGCEWCQVDVDGDTIFTSPFCTQQTSCFNGVLGSLTPYGDGDLGSPIADTIVPPEYSAVGPITGAIIVLVIVIAFATYCYRQNLESVNEQLYINSLPENNFGMPLSRLDYDDISPHDDGDLGGNSMNRNLLRPMQNVAVPDVSPYRMNAAIGYRPPNAESDHGYSTMTPREDSEHLCFALAEPLINNKRISMSDSASINTSVSSPTNHNNYLIPIDKPTLIQKDGTTMLSSPHHIQAPVTVHHPMEAS